MLPHHLEFAVERTEKTPYLFGDVFTKDDQELTLLTAPIDTMAFGLLKIDGVVRIKAYKGLESILDQGFIPNEEYIEMSKEMRVNEIYAPRKLEDGTWSGLMPLAFTTSICIGFNDWSPFETRYCFGDNQRLPRHITALYWLSRLKTKNSLPVGNCAYRGILGNDPIIDAKITQDYYQNMYDLKHRVLDIDGKDIHGVANDMMVYVFHELIDQKKAEK